MVKYICLFLFVFFSLQFNSDQVRAESASYTIAYLNNFPPFQYEGTLGAEGFMIDMLQAISAEEGLEFKFVPMNLYDAVKALEAGSVDGIAGLKYTAERAESFDYSQSFITVSYSLIVSKDNNTIKTLADLGNKVVAMERGDASLKSLRDIRKVNVVVANDQQEAFRLLELGRADAFLGDSMFIQNYLNQKGFEKRYKSVNDVLYPGDYALAINKDNSKLLESVNRGLIKVRVKQTYQTIYNKWFGIDYSPVTNRLKGIIQVLVIVLIIAALYVFITTRWNKTLKKQVAIHTRRLESANQILEQKITEEKRTRLQLVHKEKMHSLGQLVAGIAHEIRNPLTSIQAFVELIPNKYENRQFREEVSTFVPQEINRLNTLLNNLLDYAKPQEPRKEIFSLERCFNSVLTLFQLQLDQRRIIFKKNVNAEHFVYADYGQIKQVLVNVLLNAMEAIEAEGEITITSHKNQDQVYLQIDDNGVGIDEDQLKMVFETFYTNKKAGTGLGLSLSLQYMKENNGDLWIESEKDQGTKVTLVLPEGGEANEPPSTVDH